MKRLTRRQLLATAALGGPGLLLPAGALARIPPEEGSRVAGAQATAHGGFRLALPGLSRDGPPPTLSVSTGTVSQGGTTLVRVNQGVGGEALLFGRRSPLAAVGGEVLGFVGVGTQDPPGVTTLRVRVQLADGREETFERPLTVLKTNWTVDYITLPPPPPPDPNAPPPPPPPPDETELLPVIYAGVTAPLFEPGWSLPLAPPVRVTGYFGEQRSFNGGPVQGHHGGTDFGANLGTPVLASNRGRVVLAGLYRVRGNIVILDHGAGVFTLYGHLDSIAVAAGAVVAKGAKLGEVGSTGLSTGPHLHWEVAVAGVLVDGLRWLDGSQGF